MVEETGLLHHVQLLLTISFLAVAASTTQAQSLREGLRRPAAKPAAVAQPAAPAPAGTPIPVEESLQQYLTKLVLEEVPREYENTKKWGGTKRVMSGLDWELDGIRVETRRQFRDANHGTWSRYKLKLVDPEQTFEVRLENLRDLGAGIAGFDLVCVAQLDCSGRISEWRRGVQLVSLGGQADAKVRLVAHTEVGLKLDTRTFPPDIVAEPKITAAELTLQEFELRQLGEAKGPVVKQVGELLEEGLQDYLAENREKLAEKMNKQLEKKKGKLRLPLSKLTTSDWGTWFSSFFGRK